MYDVVVIGNDLSALIAALAAARRGMNVALIRDGGHLGLHRPPGYSFPLDPFPPTGFGPGQTIDRFLKEIDLDLPDFLPASDRSGPVLQLILPKNRLDISADKDQLSAELGREFPHLGKNRKILYQAAQRGNHIIDQMIEKISYNSPLLERNFVRFSWKTTAALGWRAQSYPLGNLIQQEKSIQTLVQSMGLISSYLNIKSAGDLAAAYALALPFRLGFYQSKGRGGFLLWLKDTFSNLGQLFDTSSVMRIKARSEIAIDLSLNDSTEVLKSRRLIVSANWEKLNLLLGQGPFSPLAKPFKVMQPCLFPFTIHLGILEQALPDEIAPYVIVNNGNKKSSSWEDVLFLEMSRPGDLSRAPKGRLALSVTLFSREPPWRMMTEELRETATNLFSSLKSFLPFLQHNIEYLDLDESILIAKKYQEMISYRYDIMHLWPAGFGIQPHITTRPNIFITGGMLWAGLGYEGEVLSGLLAANLAVK